MKDSEKQQVRITHKNLYGVFRRAVDDAKWGFSPDSSEGRAEEGEE